MLFGVESKARSLQTHALMRRALDLLPDGVLIIGSNREVLYANAAFEALWDIPTEVMNRGDNAMLTHVVGQLDDPQSFIELVNRLYNSPQSSEDDIRFKDGRVFHRRSVALDVEDGGFSRIWIFSDVTEAWSARIDPLTGLLNRRAYSVELPNFVASASPDTVTAFAIIDVDHFKAYNDLYGHAAGDAALERLGSAFRELLIDVPGFAFRIGGEEFAIVSTHPDQTSAVRFHEQILQHVRKSDTLHAGNAPHGIFTISLGVGFVKGNADLPAIFGAVDRSLYRAKKSGRNRICLSNSGDGTDRAFDLRNLPLKPSQESPLCPAINDDVTKIRRADVCPVVPADGSVSSSNGMQSRLFGVLTKSVPGFVWLTDDNGNATFVNENWLRYTGFSLTRSLAKGWLEALHPVDAAKVEAAWPLQPTAEVSAHEAMIRIRCSSGVYRWYLVRSNPLDDGSGRWIGCATDVHEQTVRYQKDQSQIAILNLVTSNAPLPSVLEALCRLGEEQLSGSACTILLLNEEGTEFAEGSAAAFLPEHLRALLVGTKIGPRVGSCGTAAFERRDVISGDIMTDPLWQDWRDVVRPLGVQACWSRPVYAANGNVLAVLGFYFREKRVPSNDELESLENLRQLASVAIEKVRIGQALRESEEHYRHAVEHNPQIPWTADPSGKILSASSRWTQVTGLSLENATGDRWLRALHPDDVTRVTADWSRSLQTGHDLDIKFRLRLLDDSYRWVRSRAVARRNNGRIIKWYGAAEDIHDLEIAAERLRRRADHDDLTGLLNRQGFQDFLRTKLSLSRSEAPSVSLMTVDIGGFRHVNDRFGDEAGDAALRLFGRHLRRSVGHRGVVARLAGDEFGIVFHEPIQGAQLQLRAAQLARELNRQLSRSAKTQNCFIRIGCATSERSQKAEELLRRAKLALYAAKKDTHRPVKLFTPAIRQAVDERSTQIELAKQALNARWVVPFYQPMVSLETGRVAGAEALLRISHPERGELSPAQVWAALDAPRVGKAISDRMFAAITDDLSDWQASLKGMGSISINLSTETLLQDGFAKVILQKVHRKGLAPAMVTVEITERVLVDDLAPKSRQGLLELQRHGVRISLDDFGTGFASLTHLQKLPVNEIKIDQSFVKDLADRGPNAAIVKSMINLGVGMGVDVVAEGVETGDQARLLREWGCRFAQGYYFFKPMPAKEFGRLLKNACQPSVSTSEGLSAPNQKLQGV